MNEDKKFTKIKRIFLVEYLLIAVVVLVIAILKLTGVMPNSKNRLLVYNIITTLGGVFIIVTFLLALFDKKRREKVEMLDKSLLLPLAIYLLPFDIYCFFKYGTFNEEFVKYSVAIVLIYIFLIYTFLGIYHYYKPSKEILNAYEEMKKEEELEKEKENQQEVPEEPKKDFSKEEEKHEEKL